MDMRPLLLKFIVFFALFQPGLALPIPPITSPSRASQAPPIVVPRPHLVGQRGANDKKDLPANGELPEAAGTLPLLSAIGAGALLGGLLSTRRTRR
jgi:hypothetical protein